LCVEIIINYLSINLGSSSGFGATIGKEFTKEKADVILHGRNVERLESVYRECKELATLDSQKVDKISSLID